MLERFRLCPFPRTTSSVALQPLLTTPEVSFVDTILSSYHRFQAQWTARLCRLSSRGAGRCARVLQTRTHQIDNSSPWQQEVNRLQKTVATIVPTTINSLLIKIFDKSGRRTFCLNLHSIILFKITRQNVRRRGDLCVNRRRFRVLEMTSCSSVSWSHEVRGSTDRSISESCVVSSFTGTSRYTRRRGFRLILRYP